MPMYICSKKEGGPSLDWAELQPILYAAEGDVLVLLDCCHAAIKTRGTASGKMEILAACASGARTPAPGKLSFTSVFVRQVRKRLESKDPNNEPMSIRWLQKHLWDKNTHLGLTRRIPHSYSRQGYGGQAYTPESTVVL